MSLPMREIIRTPTFHIYDDVLSPSEYGAVWDFMQLESYQPVHNQRWEKVWRLGDGSPLAGPGVFTHRNAAEGGDGARYYPTHRAIDRVIEAIFALAGNVAELVGTRDRDWSFLTAKAFLYPVGTGLSWHIDSKTPTGAYVFYTHPRWKSGWGGELLIGDESCLGRDLESYKTITTAIVSDGRPAGFRREEVPSAFDDRRTNEVLAEVAVGHYIQPKPNRLVVMRNGIPHAIAKVDPAAGENVRCSITGFFQP